MTRDQTALFLRTLQIDAHHAQAMAWEVEDQDGINVVDKPGGLNNSSTYIGLVPTSELGL